MKTVNFIEEVTMTRLSELLNNTDDNTIKVLLRKAVKEDVVTVSYLFDEKKRQDKWWNEALERNCIVNNVEKINE